MSASSPAPWNWPARSSPSWPRLQAAVARGRGIGADRGRRLSRDRGGHARILGGRIQARAPAQLVHRGRGGAHAGHGARHHPWKVGPRGAIGYRAPEHGIPLDGRLPPSQEQPHLVQGQGAQGRSGGAEERQEVQDLSLRSRLRARIRATILSRSTSTTCGPMVLDALIKIKSEQGLDADLPPFVPRGHLRFVLDEHGRRATASPAPLAIEDIQGRHPHHAAAAHGRDQGPGARLHALLRAIRLDQAVAADGVDHALGARSACRAPSDREEARRPLRDASCAPAAQPRARAIGGTATSSWARRSCSRPIAGSPIARRDDPGERLDNLEDPFRLYRCHTIMNCAQRVPQGPQPGQGDRRDQEDGSRARALCR